MLKFLVDGGIVTIRSTILIPVECATVNKSSKEILKEAEVRHENFKIALHSNFPDQEMAIEGTLSAKGRTELSSLLKENLDIFAWQPSDMTGGAISAILITERGTVQTLVYFVPMEKLVLALVFAAKRSLCVDGSGAGLILTSQGGTEFTYALRFHLTASNNEAEYEALIAGLRIAAQMGVRNVNVSVDSKLVANQVLGTYVTKEENMVKYLEKAKSLISGFANFSISQVPRSKNKKADALSKIASTSFAHLSKQVLVEVLKEKSIQDEEVATVVEEEGPTWMTPIIEYLKDGTLPDDRKEASKLRIKAR
ncbi:reverse transcriptase domain-containing protein [Tanacetum coccineum]